MLASVFCATSLDGFIARQDGGLDWLPETAEPHGYDEFIAMIDAIVMGRNTFETVLTFGAWPFRKPVVVLTSTPEKFTAPTGANCQFMAGTPLDVVAQLSERGFRHLYVDGGITIQRFLAAGLIQRLTITRIPVVLGSGIPLFGSVDEDIRFEHVATRTFSSGLVQSEYRVRERLSGSGASPNPSRS